MSTEDALIRGLPMFGGSLDQWPIFYMKLKFYLESKGLLHLIEGTEKKPTSPVEDATAKMYITSRLRDSVVHIVYGCATAREMIETLKRHYESQSAMSLLGKMDQLLDLSFKPGDDMASHLGMISHLTNQIYEAGGLDKDKLQMVIMLRSMPNTDDWRAAVGALKAQSEKELSKEKVATVLTEISHSLKTGGKSAERRPGINAFAAVEKPHIACFGCGKKGHKRYQCPLEKGRGRNSGAGQRHDLSHGSGNYAFTIGHGTRPVRLGE